MADHPGGGEDRPLRLRGAGAVLGRPDRPDAADRQRGAVLGRRRHRHGDHGHVARGRRDLRPGHAASRSASGSRSASARADEPKVGAFCVVRARRRLRRLRRCARAPGTTRPPTSGCSTARRRGRPTAASPTCTSSIASVDRELGSRGQAAFVVPPGTHGPRAGHQGQEARPARLAHRRRLPRRLPRPRRAACSAARRSSTSASPAPARARSAQVAGGDADLRGHAARRSARRRSASPAPPTSTRSTTPRSASSSAARSSRTRRSRSRSPT